MVRLTSWEDYLSLPTTSWNIKQPPESDANRENALSSGGDGLDLVIVPGLAFTADGKRFAE